MAPATPPAAGNGLFEVEFVRDVRIPTADPAVTLGADLHLPIGAGPVPLLVLALPYRKDFGGADLLHRYFARRGYACMTLDLLGTGSSDGDPRAPFSAEDGQDAVDAITWGAAQPWCDGGVGMWGHSYGGMTALRAASMRPAPLKAIIPVQGLVDPELDFVHPDHARGCFGAPTWMAGMLGNLLLPPLDATDDGSGAARWRARLDRSERHVLDLFQHPPGDPMWRGRAVDVAAIDVPALCFLGWRDLFADATSRAFEAMTGPKRLIAGPWMHVIPVVSDEGPLDFLGICLSWWDRWLKDVQNGADEEPSAFYVQGPSPYWTALDAWPPRGRTQMGVDARAPGIPLNRTTRVEVSDPTVGALSGFTRLPTSGVGLPHDQHHDDLRSACWTSEPLTESLAVLGRPEVRLGRALSDRVVVKLTHVDPAGRSVFITSGALGEGSAGGDTVRLDVTAYQVPLGHRLRVVLSDSDFPRLWPLPDSRPPQAEVLEVLLPTPASAEMRDVVLPEQPAYLLALAETLRAGQGGASWTLERELVTSRLTLTSATTPAAAQGDSGVSSSSTAIATVAPTERPEVRTDHLWAVRWPSRETVTVHVETRLTDSGFTARGRVTEGDDVVLDKTWSTHTDHTANGGARA